MAAFFFRWGGGRTRSGRGDRVSLDICHHAWLTYFEACSHDLVQDGLEFALKPKQGLELGILTPSTSQEAGVTGEC